MTKILLVSDGRNFIVQSLARQLEVYGYLVKQTGIGATEIEAARDDYKLILICAENISSRRRGLTALRQMSIEEDIPVFVIGNNAQLTEVEQIIPVELIKKKVQPPVNVRDVVEKVGSILAGGVFEPVQNRKKILVVDDSGAMLRSVKSWLEGKYDVILANSGAMAIKYLVTDRPDLILLDYEMPICDGRQVLEMIRAEKDFADIPVIFLTNKNDRESVMNVSALKPDGYLLKTMEPAQIIQAIDLFFIKKRN